MVPRTLAKVEALREELGDAVAQSAARVDLLERQLRASDTELQAARDEFRQYKARAHALLAERSADVNLKRVAELETQLATARSQLAYVCAREQQVIRRKCVLMRLSWACWLRRRERERALAESLSRGDREHLELTQVRERLQETEAQLGPWRERAEQMLRWREECERLSDKLSALERSYRDGTHP